MVSHAYKPSTQETGVGGLKQHQGQPELHSKLQDGIV